MSNEQLHEFSDGNGEMEFEGVTSLSSPAEANGIDPTASRPRIVQRRKLMRDGGLAAAALTLFGLGVVTDHKVEGVDSLRTHVTQVTKERDKAKIQLETARSIIISQYLTTFHANYIDTQGAWEALANAELENFGTLAKTFEDAIRKTPKDQQSLLEKLLVVKTNVDAQSDTVPYVSQVDTYKNFLSWFKKAAESQGLPTEHVGIYLIAFAAVQNFQEGDQSLGSENYALSAISWLLDIQLSKAALIEDLDAQTPESSGVIKRAEERTKNALDMSAPLLGLSLSGDNVTFQTVDFIWRSLRLAAGE